jgi:hypothetical protein
LDDPPFARVHPLYVAKVERKGRSRAEVDEVVTWLTGYDQHQIDQHVADGTTFRDFFAERHERQLDEEELGELLMLPRPTPDRASIAPRLRPLLPSRSVSSVVSTTGISARSVVPLRSRSDHL